MKRSTLLQHLRKHGCYLKREGRAHSRGPIRRRVPLRRSQGIPNFPICLPERFAAGCQFQKSANKGRLANSAGWPRPFQVCARRRALAGIAGLGGTRSGANGLTLRCAPIGAAGVDLHFSRAVRALVKQHAAGEYTRAKAPPGESPFGRSPRLVGAPARRVVLRRNYSANISCSPRSTERTVSGASRPSRLTRRSVSTVRS